MYKKILRNESYCLGISVLVIFMVYYIIICNKWINTNQNYKVAQDVGIHLSQNPKWQSTNKDSMNAKNSLTYSIFDAFNSVIKRHKFSEHIIVHLDLKGAPPKLSYLKSFLILIKSFGATGILVEYEDMFPYSDELEKLSAFNAYSVSEIRELYSAAKEIGLEFIPLLQTFGHLEFMLKLKEFSHLREIPTIPQAICPTNNGTMIILKKMIDQVMKLHSGIKWLHIGSDEVYYLGECNRCQQAIINKYWSKDDLFINHATQVAKYINTTYHITPIMWDDEFRKIPLDIIKASDINKIVEIMVWQYAPGIAETITNDIWDKYGKFKGVWIASAFKGAEYPNEFITDISKRVNNNKEWIEMYQMLHASIPFNGITLTGWQRFDHFAVLCELLPQAVPSLALSISYIKTNKIDHGTILKIGEQLGCHAFLNTDPEYIEYVNDCAYPGSSLLQVVQRLYLLKKAVKNMVNSIHFKGWISSYNIDSNFASPQHVEMGLQNLSMHLFECNKLLIDTRKAMADIYDNYTINEWINLNVYSLQKQLNDLQVKKVAFLSKYSWKRNPQGYIPK